MVDGDTLKVLQVRDPKQLPWGELDVDVVIESTGFFTDRDQAAMHLEAGAPFVIVSAPSKGADATFVLGVNNDIVRPGHPQGRVQRLVHDELLRADGEGARRRLRRRAGLHDHHPRLHRRPDAGRRAAQRPASGPGRGAQHRAHLHRRGPRHGPGAGGDAGQARRRLAPGPRARRLASPTSPPCSRHRRSVEPTSTPPSRPPPTVR